jgi:hypothetical protein
MQSALVGNLPENWQDDDWLKAFGQIGASGIAAQSGPCDAYSSLILIYCLLNGRCRIAYFANGEKDHSWIVLVLGRAVVVVDGWVLYPAVCTPPEARDTLYGMPSAEVTMYPVDVIDAVPQIGSLMRDLIGKLIHRPAPDVKSRREELKEELRHLKEEPTPALRIEETNIKLETNTQYGFPLTGGRIRYAPRPQKSGLRRTGFFYEPFLGA